MRKQLLIVSLFVWMMGFLLTPSLAAAQDPVSMLTSVADQMISTLKAKKMTIKSNVFFIYSL